MIPSIAMRRPLPWRSWERSEDYYSEGQLMWLDADTLIREKSGGRRSLDDFAKAFFGINDGSFVPSTYSFEDVVKALNAVQPYDWATFLRARLDGHTAPERLWMALLAAVTSWFIQRRPSIISGTPKCARKADRPDLFPWHDRRRGRPADRRALGRACLQGRTDRRHQIIAVNGIAFDVDRLKTAIKDANKTGAAIELLVKNGDRYRTVKIDYHDGLRYPHLERSGQRGCTSGSDPLTAKLTLSQKLVGPWRVSGSFALWILSDLIVPESDALRINAALIFIQHMKSHS